MKSCIDSGFPSYFKMQSLLFVYEMASLNALLENVSIKSVPNTSIAAFEAAFGFFVAIF